MYALLFGAAGGILGVVCGVLSLAFFLQDRGFNDDTVFALSLGVGVCVGLAVGIVTSRRAWFHWGCVLVGTCGGLYAVSQAMAMAALSEARKGTGPLAGLGEILTAYFCGFAALGCLMLLSAGLLRIVGAWRKQRRAAEAAND